MAVTRTPKATAQPKKVDTDILELLRQLKEAEAAEADLAAQAAEAARKEAEAARRAELTQDGVVTIHLRAGAKALKRINGAQSSLICTLMSAEGAKLPDGTPVEVAIERLTKAGVTPDLSLVMATTFASKFEAKRGKLGGEVKVQLPAKGIVLTTIQPRFGVDHPEADWRGKTIYFDGEGNETPEPMGVDGNPNRAHRVLRFELAVNAIISMEAVALVRQQVPLDGDNFEALLDATRVAQEKRLANWTVRNASQPLTGMDVVQPSSESTQDLDALFA